MFIRINGQTNRLTGINHTYANGNTQFNYLVTMKEDGTAFIRMGKGHYILKNFETWTGMAQPLEKTEQLYSQAVTLIGGTTATYGGDGITGVVSAERDGYLITSIPYDENFVLKVDGKETLLFRANTAFLGAKNPIRRAQNCSCVPCARTDGWQLVQPDGRNAGTHPCDL